MSETDLDYQFFQLIWPNLLDIFSMVKGVHPPDPSLNIGTHWKRYPNFTGLRIRGEGGELIGSETCYFILPCNQDGKPLEPVVILVRQWRDLRRYF